MRQQQISEIRFEEQVGSYWKLKKFHGVRYEVVEMDDYSASQRKERNCQRESVQQVSFSCGWKQRGAGIPSEVVS